MSTPPPPEPPPRPTAGDPLADGPEAPAAAAPPPAPDGPRRLTRSRDDRVLGGVAGGIAEYFGIDPVIVRILLIVLVFFGGAGVLLYLAALLLVPTAGDPPPRGPQRNRALVIVGVAALLIVAGPFAIVVGGALLPLAFLLIVVLAVAWLATGTWPERDARAVARSAALGLGLLIVLFVVGVAAAWATAAGGDWVVATLVIVAGFAVLAGAFLRPVRWLVPLALALAIPAGAIAAADVDVSGGKGEKRYRPGTAAEVRDRYELGVGELRVDLRDVDFAPGSRREIDVDLGIGYAVVLVAEDVCVGTRAEIGAGDAEIFGRQEDGVDVDVEDLPRNNGAPQLLIDAEVDLGALRVANTDREPRRSGPSDERDRNEACAA